MAQEHKFKKNYRPEFDMGLAIYNRLDQLEISADRYGILVRSGTATFATIKFYFSILEGIFIILRKVMYETSKREFEEKFYKIKEQIKNVEINKTMNPRVGIPESLIDNLTNLHIELYEKQQEMGMGVRVYENIGFEEKLKRGLSI